ncbi:glutamyl-tRNA reductase, partial [Candidatus Poribacteria bacterium]|nr:glutamyl-tRNA reductase [Candidatus Poribacteria bacterium]
MPLVCFGLNYRSAPIELLEAVSFNAEDLAVLLKEIAGRGEVDEIAGLSTCNRTEFYFVAKDEQAALDAVRRAAESRRGLDLRARHEHTYSHFEDEAARHLFEVACGVDSLVVGERQILGQLRAAYDLGKECGTIGE